MILKLQLETVKEVSLADHFVELSRQDISRLDNKINELRDIVFSNHNKKLYKIWKDAALLKVDEKEKLEELSKEEVAIKKKIAMQNNPKTMEYLQIITDARDRYRRKLASYLRNKTV